jgi:hypothetical protein
MEEFLSDHARQVILGDRQCTATSKSTGERCKRSSAIGQFVCDHHGAKAPLSLQAAKERLAILCEPALDVLYRATRAAPACTHCGRSDADRDPTAVRAAIAILDRYGLGPHATVALEAAANTFADLSTSELIERLESMLAVARQFEQQQLDTLDAYVVDADAPIQNADVRFPNATQQSDERIGASHDIAKDSDDDSRF